MKHKVQGCIIPSSDNHVVVVEPFSRWYDADNHLDAAGMFILEYPEVNCKDILVVDESYNLGSYPLDHAKMSADYIVGLRHYSQQKT